MKDAISDKPRLAWTRAFSLGGLPALALSGALACGDSENEFSDGPAVVDGGVVTPPTSPFETAGPSIYVPKVKNLLTGLPAIDAEVQAVLADPNALRGLIDEWMKLPEFQGRMLDFFKNAFQQNQVTVAGLREAVGINFRVGGPSARMLELAAMESFPRTVWDLVERGRPLTDAVTTRTYMLNTPLLSFMSYVDDTHVADDGTMVNRITARNAIPKVVYDPASKATLAETLNPASPNYMVWHPTVPPVNCLQTITRPATDPLMVPMMLGFFFGGLVCVTPAGSKTESTGSQFSDADWNDWRPVTIAATGGANPNTAPIFFDIPKLRAANTLYLHTPRIGYFGTLAFEANWPTNAGNESRVTANQALIVAIGQSISGENSIVQFPLNAADANHASNPACAACHKQLDPFRQYFRQSYSFTYHDQTDAKVKAVPAGFSFGGVTKKGSGVGDVAAAMASHPDFALAWAGKLAFWANTMAALPSDPELVRVADAFKASNFDFKTLVRELFSSPLVTFAGKTQTTDVGGVLLSISRRDQFCASLSNRLRIHDVCGSAAVRSTASQSAIAARALLMPADTYFRAYALPALPTNPDLFYRSSVEGVCSLVADQVVDTTSTTVRRFDSTKVEDSLTDLVATVMGLPPSDPRSAKAKAILADNYAQATASGAPPKDALKATFTLACLSPSSVLVGQ